MTSSRGVYDSKGLMEGRRWHPHNCPLFFRHARAILADRTHVQHNLPTKQLILIVHVLFWTTTGRESGWSCPKHKIKIKIAQEIQMMMILKIEMMSHAAFHLPQIPLTEEEPGGAPSFTG